MAVSKGYYEEDFNENVVFVVPCFEMQKGYARSKNKKHLLEDFGKGLIRPFHNESCWWCHSPEEHPHWLDIPLRKSDQSKIVFNATWNKNWEPFYIGSKDVPLFDERFKQYGFDRQQQICELFTAGYTFSVLDDAFLVHDGWKFPHAAARLEETYRNWVLFNFHYQEWLHYFSSR
ncbi:Oidioi.mRNA.OKI2018_I69.PAR.g8499.t1.cds [Oikopleura dioica]|uniref:Beta-1,4-glucuronyltransferase 1 n=1 Tax=Oikopleura dioica TaxID=34765 RepID=A0ABN7RK99_OIKDI|nr:Oidioi.mRNA.OKI2018_I69.PAR.g8499.t1.cds [Oikopleura dioica]